MNNCPKVDNNNGGGSKDGVSAVHQYALESTTDRTTAILLNGC
jgi:hypothetical protein